MAEYLLLLNGHIQRRGFGNPRQACRKEPFVNAPGQWVNAPAGLTDPAVKAWI
jgi:hypothetical protein